MSRVVAPLSAENKLAALNVSLLTAYEMYYGHVPQELVQAIYDEVRRYPFLFPKKQVLEGAKKTALMWLASRLEGQSPESSTGKSPSSGPAQSDGGSDSADSGPRGPKA